MCHKEEKEKTSFIDKSTYQSLEYGESNVIPENEYIFDALSEREKNLSFSIKHKGGQLNLIAPNKKVFGNWVQEIKKIFM